MRAGCGDHGGAILRRHVPPPERQPITGPEGHLLVGGTQLGRRHHRASRVSEDVREREREQDEVAAHNRQSCQRESPQVAAVTPVVGASRLPERRAADGDQQEAGGNREQAGVVVS